MTPRTESWQVLFPQPGSGKGAEARHGRRSPWFLEGDDIGIRRDTLPALLGSQDCQCPEQAAEIDAGSGEEFAARDLDG